MRLLYLRIANFRSIEQAELNLATDGLIAVVGRNGAGKSSIFEAVEWALFGPRRAMPVERYGSDGDCWVELEFEVGDRTYKMHRVDHQHATLTALDTGEVLAETLTAATREVSTILGLNQKMFCGTFYARQREVQALAENAKVGERREQLELLLGIQHLRCAADFAARDMKDQRAMVSAMAADTPNVDELKSELARVEAEAREKAPEVQRTSERAEALEKEVKAAKKGHDTLMARATEHGKRATAAANAASELKREQAILEGLEAQLQAGRQATAELGQLESTASKVDQLSARERELDLRRENHQRAEHLRELQRRAMAAAASHADQITKLPQPADLIALGAALEGAREEQGRLAVTLREAGAIRERTAKAAEGLHQQLAEAKRAADLDKKIRKLGNAEAAVEAGRRRWSELRDKKSEIAAKLAHEETHHQALVEGGETARCPTCKQALTGSYEDLLAAYAASIAQLKDELVRVEADLKRAAEEGSAAAKLASTVAELRAQRNVIEVAGTPQELTEKAAHATIEAETAAETEAAYELRHEQLQRQLPGLRQAVADATKNAEQRAQLEQERAQSEREAQLHAEQLGQMSGDAYDAAAHEALGREVKEAKAAAVKCVALRARADAVPLLEGRVAEQQALVEGEAAKQAELDAYAAEMAVPDDAIDASRKARDALEQRLQEAQSALRDAERQVSIESQAVNSARERLEQGRKTTRKLKKERRELSIREAVATALSEYRAHASERARPLLAQEASLLLSQVTQTRYPDVTLDDSYLLQVKDDREFFPLKRFSGGEQDLAALCLRLALSRTLARQRGVETGFVILDEVFGSQDEQRRASLLDSLRLLVDTDFRQLFVVSHTNDVVDHCDLHIKVTRRDGGPTTVEGPRVGDPVPAGV